MQGFGTEVSFVLLCAKRTLWYDRKYVVARQPPTIQSVADMGTPAISALREWSYTTRATAASGSTHATPLQLPNPALTQDTLDTLALALAHETLGAAIQATHCHQLQQCTRCLQRRRCDLRGCEASASRTKEGACDGSGGPSDS